MKFETGVHCAQRMNIYDCSDPQRKCFHLSSEEYLNINRSQIVQINDVYVSERKAILFDILLPPLPLYKVVLYAPTSSPVQLLACFPLHKEPHHPLRNYSLPSTNHVTSFLIKFASLRRRACERKHFLWFN